MPFADLIAKSPYPALTWFLVVLLVMLSMYFARVHAHRAILSLGRALHRALRLASSSILLAEKRLTLRNREVLLAAGREAKERILEREFERVDAQVRRDLAECPAINRRLSEDITTIEEDLKKSTEVPPVPPGWTNAVKSVAEVDAKGDPMVAKILEGIHTSLTKAQDQATQDYRKSVEARHKHLETMMPHWRKVAQLQIQLDGKVDSLQQRTQVIDRHIDEYEEILQKTDRAERMLSSSSLIQFVISGLVLAIAIGGALINFNLIARPMAEMVGGNNFIGGWKIADIAAMVIILVEMSMGLFLMESLRITRLFPVIGALSDKWRVIMIWVTLGFLTGLATIEAGLAFMREVLLQDELLLSATLRGDADVALSNEFIWITTAAQMGMGFILPFALTFVAIPLENFVHALRTVLGLLTQFFLRGLSMALRVLGNMFRYVSVMFVDIYDVVIFLPLWCETRLQAFTNGGMRDTARGRT